MAPGTSTRPSASRGRSSAGVSCSRKRPAGRRITRTPWTGQSKARANLAMIGMVNAGRPRKSTVTPRVKCWSISMPRWPPRLEAAHGLAPDLVQHMGGRRFVRRAEDHGRVEPIAGGADRRQLPVGEMGREDQGRLAVLGQCDEVLDAVDLDAPDLAGIVVVVEELAEMGVFGAEAADVLPRAGEDRANFGFALVRKGGAQIREADPVLRQERTEPARDRAPDGARPVGPERARQREHAADDADHADLADLPQRAPETRRVVNHAGSPARTGTGRDAKGSRAGGKERFITAELERLAPQGKQSASSLPRSGRRRRVARPLQAVFRSIRTKNSARGRAEPCAASTHPSPSPQSGRESTVSRIAGRTDRGGASSRRRRVRWRSGTGGSRSSISARPGCSRWPTPRAAITWS